MWEQGVEARTFTTEFLSTGILNVIIPNKIEGESLAEQ
jgi:hypothetical protein